MEEFNPRDPAVWAAAVALLAGMLGQGWPLDPVMERLAGSFGPDRAFAALQEAQAMLDLERPGLPLM